MIIACDTIVALDGVVLGKPKDREEAISMLKRLSGRSHEVFSGLTVIDNRNQNLISDYLKTECNIFQVNPERNRKLCRYWRAYG